MADSSQLGFFHAPSDAHARKVLCGQSGAGGELTYLQREILRILLFHLGAQRAIPLRDLMGKLHLVVNQLPDEREFKDAVRGLVLDFGVRIGACRGTAIAYYLITTEQEARDAALPYILEILRISCILNVLLQDTDPDWLATQLRNSKA